MNVLCLGGAGKICSEAVLDLVAYSDFKRITIADCEQKAGEALAASIDDGRGCRESQNSGAPVGL
jgi:saccharopine dehydrogenase-like NADP-dependent oxidoreductase